MQINHDDANKTKCNGRKDNKSNNSMPYHYSGWTNTAIDESITNASFLEVINVSDVRQNYVIKPSDPKIHSRTGIYHI